MRLREFLAAPCGRIYSGTTAFAALAAALIGLAGPRAPDVAIPLVTLICIVGGLASVGLAIDRFPVAALALLLVLPIEGGVYFAGLTVVAGAGPATTLVLFGFGLGALLATVTGGSLVRRSSSLAMPRHRGAPLVQ